jgi:hypothetical protein
MGLGAWLAAITDRKVFEVEEKKQRRAIRAKPAAAEEEIYEVFDEYNVNREAVTPVVDQLIKNFDMWIKVSYTFQLSKCHHSLSTYVQSFVSLICLTNY